MRSVLLLLAAILLPLEVAADVPTRMRTQGVLRDAEGNVAPSGSYALTFKLFAQSEGGAALWTEDRHPPGTKSCAQTLDACVEVVDGVFVLDLGQEVPLPPSLFGNQAALWLEIAVADDPPLPRARLASSAFAFHAASADVAAGVSCTGCIGTAELNAAAVQELAFEAGSADALATLTNGAITNVFTASFENKTPVDVPGYLPDWTSSTIEVPDVGTAKSLTVTLNLKHDNPEQLEVILEPPAGVGSTVILHNKGPGTAGGLAGSWPEELNIADGSFGPFLGMNLSGVWTLKVRDNVHPPNEAGTLLAWGIKIEYSAHSKIKVAGGLEVSGDLKVGAVGVVPHQLRKGFIASTNVSRGAAVAVGDGREHAGAGMLVHGPGELKVLVGQTVAQVFRTSPWATAIARIRLWMYAAPGRPLEISVRPSTGGMPGSVAIPGSVKSDFGQGTPFRWFSFQFTPPLPVSPDAEYALVLRVLEKEGVSEQHALLGSYWDDKYPEGTFVRFHASSATWTVADGPETDLSFEISEQYIAAGEVRPTDASLGGELVDSFIGFAAGDGEAGDTVEVAFSGIVGDLGPLTLGAAYYLSDEPGKISAAAGTHARHVGTALGSGDLLLSVPHALGTTRGCLVKAAGAPCPSGYTKQGQTHEFTVSGGGAVLGGTHSTGSTVPEMSFGQYSSGSSASTAGLQIQFCCR